MFRDFWDAPKNQVLCEAEESEKYTYDKIIKEVTGAEDKELEKLKKELV